MDVDDGYYEKKKTAATVQLYMYRPVQYNANTDQIRTATVVTWQIPDQ